MGETIEMPNVVRTVTRSTMVAQYLAFCSEEYEPLSRATLFRILEVREASQCKSLQGLDNIAADGSTAFTTMEEICERLAHWGVDMKWSQSIIKRLQKAKEYLKTDYKVHCQESESPCADHCRVFALSDPADKEFQIKCAHQHTMACENCDNLKSALQEIHEKILEVHHFSVTKDAKEELLHDFEEALNCIQKWKGSSKETVVVSTYAHLFDSCTQDWYAVASIIENLLLTIKSNMPLVSKACIRSDEAGCYHNNLLIASLPDIGKRVGISVQSYHFSEPQQGKDIYDRIISPLKSSIRKYCNEGHNIINATDMHTALNHHVVKRTCLSVNEVNQSIEQLVSHKIPYFSSYHNFMYENDGIRVWRAFGVGKGKKIPINLFMPVIKVVVVNLYLNSSPVSDRVTAINRSSDTSKNITVHMYI